MKKTIYTTLLILSMSTMHCFANDKEKLFVITRAKHGLFSAIFTVLNNLRWCHNNNIKPAVYWDNTSLYYEESIGNNVWEYYFEPVSDGIYTPGDTDNIIETKQYKAPDGYVIPQPFSKNYEAVLAHDFRQDMYTIIDKYIKIKPAIAQKVEDFYQKQMMGKATIGIHLRGTDKNKEVASDSTVESICKEANIIAKDYPGCQFFIATDEQAMLDQAIEILNGDVLYWNSYRALDDRPIHRDKRVKYSKAKLGEEVLIETLLLAKTDFLIHTRSNVSTAVLLFNPTLKEKTLY